jgi:propanediol dehydratase small subunit
MFQELKAIIQNYAAQYNVLRPVYDQKQKVIHAEYIGDRYAAEYGALKNEFESAVQALRDSAISESLALIGQLRSDLKNTITEDLGQGTIAELELLKDAKMSKFELLAYAEKYTGNYKALRILRAIAEANKFYLSFTDADDVLERINSMQPKIIAYFKQYAGVGNNSYYTELMLNGGIIDNWEAEYKDFLNPFVGNA